MSEPWKGGKGKRAPYETTHYRIPQPIHKAVQMFSDRYKQLVSAGVTDPAGEKLIRRVEDAICADCLPVNTLEETDKHVNSYKELPIPGNRLQDLEDKLAVCQHNYDALREENNQMRSRLSEALAAADHLTLERDRALAVVESLKQQLGEQSQSAPQADPKAIALLKEGLALKPNAGGAIKRKIEQALALLTALG